MEAAGRLAAALRIHLLGAALLVAALPTVNAA
eukprot:SAG31_NODE_28403_length_410_cov_1.745981_1_plen_31_part_01